MYQTAIGAITTEAGRRGKDLSSRPRCAIPLLFQKAGYDTCIGSGLPEGDYSRQARHRQGSGKNGLQLRVGRTDV